MVGALLVLAVASLAPCECPQTVSASERETPLAVVPGSDELPGLVACGFLDHREADDVVASEVDVFACSTTTSVLTIGATQAARIHAEEDRLLITEIESWPFGPGWTWVWVPVWSYSVIPAKTAPLVSKTRVLQPPKLTATQVTQALAALGHPAAIPVDGYADVIGRLLAAALTGNGPARRAFERLPELLALDGLTGETYEMALRTYRAYYPST